MALQGSNFCNASLWLCFVNITCKHTKLYHHESRLQLDNAVSLKQTCAGPVQSYAGFLKQFAKILHFIFQSLL